MQSQSKVQGSMKNKIVATELVEERNNCNFDQDELWSLYFKDPEANRIKAKAEHDVENDPIMRNTHKYYEWTLEEVQQDW